MKRHLYIILTTLCVHYLLLGQQCDYLTVHRLTEKTALILGGINNTHVLAISTKKGLVMIDAPFNKILANRYKEAASKEFNRHDFIYLINSHGDFCHIGGNQAYENCHIVAHKEVLIDIEKLDLSQKITQAESYISFLDKKLVDTVKDSIKWKETYQTKILMQELVGEMENDMKITIPDIIFEKELTLNLDDINIQMSYYGYAHGFGDIIIYIPEEKILFTGGIFYKHLMPITRIDDNAPDNIVESWLEILNKYTSDSIEIDFIIPSHWGIDRIYLKDGLLKFRNYIDLLWTEVKRLKEENKTLEQVKAELVLKDKFPEMLNLQNSYRPGKSFGRANIHEDNIERFYKLLNR